jgi:hypothetical protein
MSILINHIFPWTHQTIWVEGLKLSCILLFIEMLLSLFLSVNWVKFFKYFAHAEVWWGKHSTNISVDVNLARHLLVPFILIKSFRHVNRLILKFEVTPIFPNTTIIYGVVQRWLDAFLLRLIKVLSLVEAVRWHRLRLTYIHICIYSIRSSSI